MKLLLKTLETGFREMYPHKGTYRPMFSYIINKLVDIEIELDETNLLRVYDIDHIKSEAEKYESMIQCQSLLGKGFFKEDLTINIINKDNEPSTPMIFQKLDKGTAGFITSDNCIMIHVGEDVYINPMTFVTDHIDYIDISYIHNMHIIKDPIHPHEYCWIGDSNNKTRISDCNVTCTINIHLK